jgi:tetratricopeptide (TPR) repeat protein
MRTLRKSSIVVLLLILTIRGGSAQNSLIHNMDKNTLVDFSEIIEYLRGIDEKSETGKIVYNIVLQNYGYLLLVKSLGECRNISVDKKEFLNYAFKAMGIYEQSKDLFNKEVFIESDAGNYWLPIQDGLFNYWIEELKKGDLTLIYIRVYGSMGNNPENKWIFTINGFNAGYYNGLWEEALSNFNNNKDTVGLRCLKKMISLNPGDGRNYAMMGYYFTDVGNRSSNDSSLFFKADSLFSLAEKLTPEYSYQYFQRAILKFYMKDYMLSWFYVDKARSLKDEHIEQWFVDDLESKLPYIKFIQMKK